ncbi:phosphatase PAP2 family protein [Variovorax dokdonensis]|uniref:Phosphatase PAP2 family protein n=1 Tax=Variovorax dokdonensis TaxID=344883 RepID=A0ABT7N5B8_9BURK|nr:phosphatase PAP2 family protein [Variovorax dokdonensis]
MPWTTDIGERFRDRQWLKILGTTVWIWVFFIGYFHLLRNPMGPVFEMPWTFVDDWVPFQPAWLIPYLSLWVYVGIAPGLQRGFLPLVAYGLWAGALCVAGLLCFMFLPTRVPPVSIDPGGFPGFAMLQGIDAAGNACPSMHVAIALFTCVWLEHILRQAGAPRWLRLINLAWFLAIAYSTMATRQHVFLDALAGGVLGGLFACASLRWRPADVPRAAHEPATVAIMDRR